MIQLSVCTPNDVSLEVELTAKLNNWFQMQEWISLWW